MERVIDEFDDFYYVNFIGNSCREDDRKIFRYKERRCFRDFWQKNGSMGANNHIRSLFVLFYFCSYKGDWYHSKMELGFLFDRTNGASNSIGVEVLKGIKAIYFNTHKFHHHYLYLCVLCKLDKIPVMIADCYVS